MSNESTSTNLNRGWLWVTLGGAFTTLINCLAAFAMAGFVVFGFSQLNDVGRSTHYAHDVCCITASALGATALLMVAGTVVYWIANRSHRRIIVAGALVAGSACLCHGILLANTPLTGSQDFRAMAGLGQALLSMISVALSILTTITNLIFVCCTTRTKERTSC